MHSDHMYICIEIMLNQLIHNKGWHLHVPVLEIIYLWLYSSIKIYNYNVDNEKDSYNSLLVAWIYLVPDSCLIIVRNKHNIAARRTVCEVQAQERNLKPHVDLLREYNAFLRSSNSYQYVHWFIYIRRHPTAARCVIKNLYNG